MSELVSIITGTYHRPRELMNAVRDVQNQTYSNIEHVIVHDGPVLDEYRLIKDIVQNGNKFPIKFYETGRQWSQFLADSISAVPFQVAQWMASGSYLMWMADDEEITEDHVELLVNLLEEKDVDFVFSRTEVWFPQTLNFTRPPCVIGSEKPRRGDITQALFRAELLDYRGFMTHVGSGTDWDQIEAWIQAGASYAFLDKVTHSHRVDKMGDYGLNKTRQRLRGQSESNSD